MSIVLLDTYSIVTLKETLIEKTYQRDIRYLEKVSSLIQNLVLCDKVLLDGERAREWDVVDVCNEFHDAFELIESEIINETDISVELSLLRLVSIEAYDSYAVSKRNYERLRIEQYIALARKLGVYLCLHPDRAGKLRTVLGKPNRPPSSELAIAHFDERFAATDVAQYAGVDVTLPAVVEYVMTFATANKVDLPTAVSEIRGSKNAIRFRERCRKIDEELAGFSGRASVHALQKLIREIDELTSKWEKDLDEGVKYTRREISLRKVWGIGAVLESMGLGIFTIKDPIISSNHADLLFLNDLYRKPTRIKRS